MTNRDNAGGGGGDLEERVAALEKQAEELEAANEQLSERLVSLEEDPLPARFDEEEAADVVDRLLGISKVEMKDDVEALLWTHAMRRLGVLGRKEYERRKKRLLARDIPAAQSATTSPGGGTKTDDDASAGAATPTPTTQTREEEG